MRLPSIDATSRTGAPVYRQIAGHIRSLIESGELAGGDKLPPIRALAVEVGVNRDTVAVAYEALATEGLVVSTVGRGTFVRSAEAGREPVSIPLAEPVEGLLAIERTRPRFGVAAGVAALHSLIPDPSFYPVDAFRRALNRVLTNAGPDLFLYGAPQGHPGLRVQLAQRFRSAGIERGPEEIVLCHGASQGIALAMRVFARAGDAIAIEVPTYHNVLCTLVALDLEPAMVPLETDGANLEVLDRVLARPDVKAFYTIPTFHNPVGSTTSLAHRRALLEIAGRHGKPVIEDAFEMDLRYEGRGQPPLAALDRDGLVVHLYSFSKSLFPGLRVGSVSTRGRAVEGLLALKHATDLSDSMPLQAALAEFLMAGAFDRHLTRMRPTLRSRRDALMEALEKWMPAGTTWTRPEGGYQTWVELPFEVDTRDLLADAARAGVLFAPGSQFLPDHRASRGLRLTVAQADESEIRSGVEALARVVQERIESDPAVREAASVHL